MPRKSQSDFIEIAVDRMLMESFSNDSSAYFKDSGDHQRDKLFDFFRTKFKWHISRSLSPRQRQVITLTIRGKKQCEIAAILGITQQVVSIYKKRAIKRLRSLLLS